MPRKKRPTTPEEIAAQLSKTGQQLGGYNAVPPDVAASLAEVYPDPSAWEPIPRALTGGRRLKRLKSNPNVIITNYQYNKLINPRYKIRVLGKGSKQWNYQYFDNLSTLQKKLTTLPDNAVVWINAYGLSTGDSDQPNEWIWRTVCDQRYKPLVSMREVQERMAKYFYQVKRFQLLWRIRPNVARP